MFPFHLQCTMEDKEAFHLETPPPLGESTPPLMPSPQATGATDEELEAAINELPTLPLELVPSIQPLSHTTGPVAPRPHLTTPGNPRAVARERGLGSTPIQGLSSSMVKRWEVASKARVAPADPIEPLSPPFTALQPFHGCPQDSWNWNPPLLLPAKKILPFTCPVTHPWKPPAEPSPEGVPSSATLPPAPQATPAPLPPLLVAWAAFQEVAQAAAAAPAPEGLREWLQAALAVPPPLPRAQTPWWQYRQLPPQPRPHLHRPPRRHCRRPRTP